MRPREVRALGPCLRDYGRARQGARVAAFAVAVAALVVHLLGPLAHAHAHGGSGEPPLASADALPAEMPRALLPLVAFHTDECVLGAQGHLDGGTPGHADEAGCGYLLPSNPGDQPGAPPATWVDTVVAAPESPDIGRACPVGERDPPDLVRDLQVIRV